MTFIPNEFQLGTFRVTLDGDLKRCKQNRLHAAYAFRRAVGVQCGKSHFSLESDQFAHGRHRGPGQPAGGTMKCHASQGTTA